MNPFALPKRAPRTCSNIDASTSGGSSAARGANASCAVCIRNGALAVPAQCVTLRPANIPYNLLLESLIEQLCRFYEPDARRREELFKAICRRLHQHHFLDRFPNLQELYHLRTRFREGFARLVIDVKNSLPGSENNSLVLYSSFLSNGQSVGHLPHPQQDLTLDPVEGFTCQQKRYQYDFEEIEKIAEGGFGIVCKARKRVDSCVYAIKMVPFRYSNQDLLRQILKEVQLLARLSHPNIVAYKTAWIENHIPIIAGQSGSPEETLSEKAGVRTSDVQQFEGMSHHLSLATCHIGKESTFRGSELFSKGVQMHEVQQDESYVSFRETALATSGVIMDNAIPCYRSSLHGHITRDHKSDGGVCETTRCDVAPRTRKALHSESNPQLQTVVAAKDSIFQLLTNSNIGATLFIQMELCSGNLADWISQRNQKLLSSSGDINVEDALHIFKQILKGVQYIHAEGLIHRDLKPHNIMFDRNGSQIKIGDFGLATISNIDVGQDCYFCPWVEPRIHTQGVGTSLYAAAEQREGSQYNCKADIYSLGVILTELVHPFTTGHERVTSLNKLSDGIVPEPVVKSWPNVANMVCLMCQRDPAKRPTVTDVLNSVLFQSKDELLRGMRQELAKKDQEISNLKSLLQKQSAELERYRAYCRCTGLHEWE